MRSNRPERSRHGASLGLAARATGVFAATLVVAAVLAAPALAESGSRLVITLHNRISVPVQLRVVDPAYSHCYYGQELYAALGSRFAATGGDQTYASRKNQDADACRNANSWIGIAIYLKQGDKWRLPSGEDPAYDILWVADYPTDSPEGNFGFNFRRSLATWLPRPDGDGLVCWHTSTHTSRGAAPSYNSTGTADITVMGDAQCNTKQPTTIRPRLTSPGPRDSARSFPPGSRDPAVAASARRPGAAAGSPAIVDLLSTVGVACPWYAYPGNTGLCDSFNVGQQQKWSLDNLTSNVRDFRVTSPQVSTDDPKLSVGNTSLSIPASSAPGTLSVSKAFTTSTATTASTAEGFKVGGSTAFSVKAAAGIVFTSGEVSVTQTINGEYNFAETKATTTTESDTRQIGVTAPALPGFTTTLDVFTTKRAANYNYQADLDFGKPGAVESVDTPANLALDQSPAKRQPCLGYVVGDSSVRNSITNIGRELLNAGVSPTDPSLAAAQRGFLQSIPFFSTPGATTGRQCPNFPQGFASSASFKGNGIGTYANTGYDNTGRPVQTMVGCVYQAPYPARSASAPAPSSAASVGSGATAGPCQQVPVTHGRVTARPGVLIDDRGAANTPSGSAPTIVGPNSSDEIIGSNRPHETIRTGSGAVDIVHVGSGNGDRVYGGGGQNIIYGGNGSGDLLVGGTGTNEIHAGRGPDRLLESNGSADLFGGPGNDTFVGHNMNGTMVGGSGNNTLIASGDISRLTMAGGTGNDTYVLNASKGTPRIVEFPRQGNDTVMIDRSLVVPAVRGDRGRHRFAPADPARLIGHAEADRQPRSRHAGGRLRSGAAARRAGQRHIRVRRHQPGHGGGRSRRQPLSLHRGSRALPTSPGPPQPVRSHRQPDHELPPQPRRPPGPARRGLRARAAEPAARLQRRRREPPDTQVPLRHAPARHAHGSPELRPRRHGPDLRQGHRQAPAHPHDQAQLGTDHALARPF